MLQGQSEHSALNTCKKSTAPVKVCWNLTSRCNLNCRFCFGPKGFTEELGTGQVKAVAQKLRAAGVQRIVLSGGEPILRKDLPEIIEFATTIGLKVSLATNGFALKESFIRKCGKHLKLVEVSLAGCNEQTELKMRGKKGLFKKVIKTLELLKQNGVQIKINTMVSKKNKICLEEIGAIAEKFGARCWKIFQFVPRNKGKKSRQEFEISDKEFTRIKQKISKKFPTLNIAWAPKKYFSRAYFNVYPNGNVSVPRISSEKNIGNILEQTVEELWKNPLFDEEKHFSETSVPFDS